MKFLKFIISLYLLSNVCPLLTKYGTEILTINDVIFESKDFDDDEEMHFKIQSKSYNFDYSSVSSYDVEYYYFSNADVSPSTISSPHHVYFKKTTNEDGGYRTKYFTIRKKRSEYRNTNGNYLYIRFPNLRATNIERATITNTEEDEGKLETWAIVLIVVICVAVIAVIIIYCICRRIRMKKAQQAAMARNVAAINAQNQANQAAYNYAAQNAAYTAGVEDAQNAYLAQQNQAQVYQDRGQNYQAQVYQNNNYTSPPLGSVPDTGYNSKAVM
jgi:type II secretory pathway pseudopilin PulG